jgi:hypothetical protein
VAAIEKEGGAGMRLTEEMDFSTGTLDQHPAAGYSTKAGGYMETRKLCAYNQTRECFLGLEVAGADLSLSRLKDQLATLALKSGEGLWLLPFRGIPEWGVRAPLDLVYLDQDCRVLDVVESFPVFRVNAATPQAASVLALPTHSIYSSQTQPGDLLVLCVAEEMQQRLERFTGSVSPAAAGPTLAASPVPAAAAGVVQGAVLLRERPLWSGGPGVLELGDRSKEDRTDAQQTHMMELIEPGRKDVRPPRSWMERWWSPDPRKAPREEAPGLAAYYWTGGPPEAHTIKDISPTGLYVITEERWYPGTLVLMTLHNTTIGEKIAERTICVHSRAIRWGNDGVGLQFVLPKTQDLRNGLLANGADRKDLDRFLLRLRKGKG